MKIFLSLFILAATSMSHAAILEETISSSWKNDKLIQAQETRIGAASLNRFARFLPNNPQISYADADNTSWRTFGVSLDVGIPGKAFVLSELDSTIYTAEKNELAAKKNELATFVMGQFINCASNNDLIDVYAEATQDFETLMRTLTARYEMGQATQSERIGIELQHRQALIEYNAVKDEGQVACTKFNQVLDQYGMSPLTEKDIDLPDDLDAGIVRQMGTTSAEYVRAENEMKVARVMHKTAIWNYLPDITLSYYRNYYSTVASSPIVPTQWTTTYLVSVNLPLFYPFYNGVNINQAKATALIAERRAVMDKIQSEKVMMDARNEFRRNKAILLKLRKHDLPMAETMVDSTLASYKSGKLGFSELILAKRTWLDLRKEEVELKVTLLNNRLKCLNTCDAESL